VIAGTCVDANIASTAAIVTGQAAVQWLENGQLPARLVDGSGSVHRLAGWPKPSQSTFDSQQTHRQSRQH
jgi:FAD:protein FMN transferase